MLLKAAVSTILGLLGSPGDTMSPTTGTMPKHHDLSHLRTTCLRCLDLPGLPISCCLAPSSCIYRSSRTTIHNQVAYAIPHTAKLTVMTLAHTTCCTIC